MTWLKNVLKGIFNIFHRHDPSREISEDSRYRLTNATPGKLARAQEFMDIAPKDTWSSSHLSSADLDSITQVMEAIVGGLYDRYRFDELWGYQQSDIVQRMAARPREQDYAWAAWACLDLVSEDDEFATIWGPILNMQKVDFDELYKRFLASCR